MTPLHSSRGRSPLADRIRRTGSVVALIALLGAAACKDYPSHAALPQWDDQTIDFAAALPIQDGGRLKPLDTFAQFKLLRFNGMRQYRFENGDDKIKLSPIEWFLDTAFYPETASEYRVFLVHNAEVLDAIEISHEGRKKRDRYSYQELVPARMKLIEKGSQWAKIDAAAQTPVQSQLVDLYNNVLEYEYLLGCMDFARSDFPVRGEALKEVFGDVDKVPLSAVLAKGAQLAEKARELQDDQDSSQPVAALEPMAQLLQQVAAATEGSRVLAILPPRQAAQEEWYTVYDTIQMVDAPFGPHADQIALLETMARSREDRGQFQEAMAAFYGKVRQTAESRREYGQIPSEVSFYRADLLMWSLVLYIVTFLCTGLSWMWSGAWLRKTVWTLLSVATVLLIGGVTWRCLIMSRPPVTNLYETTLFVTAIAVPSLMVTEWLTKQRIALGLAAVLGAAGLFLANKYEILDKKDTMRPLIAVLDTNFWLATHVTTVTAGYAACLLAAALSHLWLFGQMFGIKTAAKAKYSALTKMVYGTLCFGVVLSVVGTILGGVWANDSWGRFWGWDPKENGALLIVLWELVILHARLGGYIKAMGLHLMSIAGGIVVAFSWWHVNLLGVGLHAYGFTGGIKRTLFAYYKLELVVLAAGLMFALFTRVQMREQKKQAT